MRIKPSASFPHPVLSSATGDFGDRTFQLALNVREEPDSGHALLSGSMTIDEHSIQALLESGSAKSGLMITCLETYLDYFHSHAMGDVHIDLSGGKLRGSVFFRGVIVATKEISLLTPRILFQSSRSMPGSSRMATSLPLLKSLDSRQD